MQQKKETTPPSETNQAKIYQLLKEERLDIYRLQELNTIILESIANLSLISKKKLLTSHSKDILLDELQVQYQFNKKLVALIIREGMVELKGMRV